MLHFHRVFTEITDKIFYRVLKAQIIAMYQRHRFESLLEKWTNWDEEAGLYTDIYDGEIWKTFPSSTGNSAQFFTPDTADLHLGILIGSNHSIQLLIAPVLYMA